MARFIFLLLLVANLAFGGHIYLNANKPREGTPAEVNRDAMKVLSVTDPAKAQREALDARKMVETLTSAACLQFSVKPADAPRAQTAFGTMELGDRLSSKNVEDFTRFAVVLPVQRDRKAADALLAALKKANVKDVLIMADNSVSLGLFSSEEAAKRVVAEMETKATALVKGIVITPKNPQTRETIFMLRAPDAGMIGRVAVMQRDFESSMLKGVECPDSPTTAAVAQSAPSAAIEPARTEPAKLAGQPTPPLAAAAKAPAPTPAATTAAPTANTKR